MHRAKAHTTQTESVQGMEFEIYPLHLEQRSVGCNNYNRVPLSKIHAKITDEILDAATSWRIVPGYDQNLHARRLAYSY